MALCRCFVLFGSSSKEVKKATKFMFKLFCITDERKLEASHSVIYLDFFN